MGTKRPGAGRIESNGTHGAFPGDRAHFRQIVRSAQNDEVGRARPQGRVQQRRFGDAKQHYERRTVLDRVPRHRHDAAIAVAKLPKGLLGFGL